MLSTLGPVTMQPAQRAEKEAGNPTRPGDDAARAAGGEGSGQSDHAR
jgi:hypothetical protein